VRSSQVVTDTDDADAPFRQMGALDVDNTQPTLAERLKTLKVVEPPLEPSSGGPTASKSKPLTLGSGMTLTQTLIQALHSSDDGLLESCLSYTDPKLIRATVKRLPTQLVLPFVDSLVERLGRNKRGAAAGTGGSNAQRGREIIVWLRGVLMVHMGYLLTVRQSEGCTSCLTLIIIELGAISGLAVGVAAQDNRRPFGRARPSTGP
jgi:U3 small nucleolar RNA-associated protein 5